MDKLTALIGLTAAVTASLIASPAAKADHDEVPPGYAVVVLKYCANEDGNPDGRPCLWRDPDTGEGWISSSENYRFHQGGLDG